MSAPLCGLLVVWVSLLWKEDQSLSISETGEGLRGNHLHLQQIIFQVDWSQGGARIARVAHSPLPDQPTTTTNKHLHLDIQHLNSAPSLHKCWFVSLPKSTRECLEPCKYNTMFLWKCVLHYSFLNVTFGRIIVLKKICISRYILVSYEFRPCDWVTLHFLAMLVVWL